MGMSNVKSTTMSHCAKTGKSTLNGTAITVIYATCLHWRNVSMQYCNAHNQNGEYMLVIHNSPRVLTGQD